MVSYFNTDGNELRVLSFVKDLVRRDGITGLYKGMSVTLVKIVFYQGILFWTNEKLKFFLGYYEN
jgi:hypothetical protein